MASAQAPAEQPVSDTEPRLRRPLDRALLGGVCAGVAERTGLEPVVVRVMMVILVPIGGIGVAVYAAAWALIPVVPASSRSGGALARLCEAALIVVAVV
ncbi:MAG: PspC domain-containing protein, partial [Solirubrobacteraceae bacterium]